MRVLILVLVFLLTACGKNNKEVTIDNLPPEERGAVEEAVKDLHNHVDKNWKVGQGGVLVLMSETPCQSDRAVGCHKHSVIELKVKQHRRAVYLIFLHEIGHYLGLKHSEDPCDIMYHEFGYGCIKNGSWRDKDPQRFFGILRRHSKDAR